MQIIERRGAVRLVQREMDLGERVYWLLGVLCNFNRSRRGTDMVSAANARQYLAK
jgi:hypothetical protein